MSSSVRDRFGVLGVVNEKLLLDLFLNFQFFEWVVYCVTLIQYITLPFGKFHAEPFRVHPYLNLIFAVLTFKNRTL